MIIRNTGVRHARRALASPAAVPPALRRNINMIPKSILNPTPAARNAPTAVADPSSPDSDLHAALSAAQALKRKRDEADARKAELARIPDNFRQFVHIQKHTKGVGSDVTPRYVPGAVLKDPPADATLEMLLAAGAHMGHNTSLWNPACARYIYGVRDGIHIISLESTAAHLRRAARVVEEVAYAGGLVLFVGTRKGMKDAVVKAAELSGGCHLFQKWVPGTITNRDVILEKAQIAVVDVLDREVEEAADLKAGARPLVPDLVVVLNPRENYTLLDECALVGVPTIGVIDTDADPTWVTYQIPGNDDSLRATELFASVLGRAGERGQKRRMLAAADGIQTWQQPQAVQNARYAKLQEELAAERAREEMEGMNMEGGWAPDQGDLRAQLGKQAMEETFERPSRERAPLG